MDEVQVMSELSRQGSGSSCRSFYAPWSVWSAEGARREELPYGDLLHMAVIADDQIKEVSSSVAHRRVTSSALFEGRVQRAETRLQDLVEALQAADWAEAFELVWAEFWDMHALFETSRPSFGYMTPASLRVLDFVRERWRREGDGPLCTMDAGPNVHLLFRRDQLEQAGEWKKRLQVDGRIYANF